MQYPQVYALLTALMFVWSPAPLQAQQERTFVLPASSANGAALSSGLVVRSISAQVEVLDLVATTRLEIAIGNTLGRAAEAELLLPVPRDCVVRHFDFLGASAEPKACLLPADEARALYNSIVVKERDPALLEFAQWNTLRSSVFPVPAKGEQKLQVVYEELLQEVDGRIEYRLPRSEARLSSALPWSFDLRLRSARALSTAMCHSHELVTKRDGPNGWHFSGDQFVLAAPGSVEIAWLPAEQAPVATFYAYPDSAGEQGWFLMVAGLPLAAAGEAQAPRDLVVVLDSSGSMKNGKLEQARAAGQALLDTLRPGDRFNLIDFDDEVRLLAPATLAMDAATATQARGFLQRCEVGGGTNIGESLARALNLPPGEGCLPLVVFLTDGQPSAGVRDPLALRQLATEHNPYQRRVFTVGVGLDLEPALLDHLADATRGTSTFVEPDEDIGRHVATLAQQLCAPRLTSLTLAAVEAQGAAAPQRLDSIYPRLLPDLYEDGQLVVLGRYRGNEVVHLELSGHGAQGDQRWRLSFDPMRASTQNAFVARMWASRRIDELIEISRQGGGSGTQLNATADPLLREHVEEIHALSLRHGILTEWTSFFVSEGTDLCARDSLLEQLSTAMQEKAKNVRTGRAAVAQSKNHKQGSKAQVQNRLNNIYNDQLEMVQLATVVQVSDRAFFKRKDVWVDGALLARGGQPVIDEHIEFGSAEHRALIARLQSEGRAGLLSLRGNLCFELGGKVLYVGRAPSSKQG